MEFLSKEVEGILKDCIERENDFPSVLVEKFYGLSPSDDRRLRSCIKVLCESGFISIPNWAGNVPYIGNIEQKGFDYFRQKDVFIRAKLRQDPFFTLLDEESESLLMDLCRSKPIQMINGKTDVARVVEHLNKCGYIKMGTDGVVYDLSGNFSCVVSITQKGKNYFTDKENRIEEIMILGDEASVVNNIGKQYNVTGNTISDSQIQIGDENTQGVDFSALQIALNDLKTEIESLKFEEDQRQKVNELIDMAEQNCKEKNHSALTKILKEIWDFAKQTGSNMLATYLAVKFGLGA